MKSPFLFSECLVVGCGELQAALLRKLSESRIQVLGVVGSVCDLNFRVLGGTGRPLEDFVGDGVERSVPIVLSKAHEYMGTSWVLAKSAMQGLGFTTFVFLEDLIYPEGCWSDDWAPIMKSTLANIRFWAGERLGFAPRDVERSIEFALRHARAAEIGCRRFGPADISMLHPAVHVTAAALACLNPGPVVEIGSYVGGLTCSLGRAAKELGQQMVTFERGISHLAHPTLPSSDTISDLIANISAHDLEATVAALGEFETAQCASYGFEPASIKMVVMDTAGDVSERLSALAPWLAPRCTLIVDDFVMNDGGADNKSFGIRQGMYRLLGAGEIREMDILGWGTWFGVFDDGGRNRASHS